MEPNSEPREKIVPYFYHDLLEAALDRSTNRGKNPAAERQVRAAEQGSAARGHDRGSAHHFFAVWRCVPIRPVRESATDAGGSRFLMAGRIQVPSIEGFTVRIAFRFTLLVAVLVMAVGCRSTRGPATGKPTSGNNTDAPFWAKGRTGPTLNPPANRDDTGTRLTSAEQPDYNGVLAGRLVDNANRRVAKAYIQVSRPESDAGKPIEVAADDDGYFLIPGLQAGRSYMLTARVQVDGRLLAGRVQATPPQPRLVIRLTEDFATGSVPALPPHPGDVLPGREPAMPPRPFANTPDNRAGPVPSPRINQDPGWSPGSAPRSAAPVDPTPRIEPTDLENIADQNKNRDPKLERPPVTNIPSGPKLPDPDPVPKGPGAMRVPSQTVVPSCYMSGRRIVNFALNDLDGRPWELRNHHGRLILLDFWGTWCPHCLRVMPELVELQRQYGPYGLEIVGIACEQDTGRDVERKVRSVLQKYRVNYNVLLAEDRSKCPVQSQLGIDRWPTVILLDDFGNIIYRASGGSMEQLKAVIRQRLGR